MLAPPARPLPPGPVTIVDDDAEFASALRSVVRDSGRIVHVFSSADDLLEQEVDAEPGIILLDLRMQGTDGLGLQEQLARRGDARPIVFITAHADVTSAIASLKHGAVDYLIKPFREEALMAAIERAEAIARERNNAEYDTAEVRQTYATLSPREREVLGHLVEGKRNKEIARDLGLSEIMIKVHRRHVMEKMRAASLPQLVRMHDVLLRQDRSRRDG